MKRLMFKGIMIAASLTLLAGCVDVPTDNGAGAAGGAAEYSDSNSAVQTGGIGSTGALESYMTQKISTIAPSDQSYYFRFNNDAVANVYNASIAAQGRYLASHPSAKIRLEGNTDERGSREYNIGLSWRRANGVLSALEFYGAKSKQVLVVSYGEEKPVALGHTEAAWKYNRRVDLKYLN